MISEFIIDNQAISLAPGDLLQHYPGPLIIKNSQSIFVGVNTQAARLAGYNNAKEMIGTKDADLKCKAAELHELFVAQDQEVLVSGTGTAAVDVAEYADGDLHCFLSRRTFVSDHEQQKFVMSYMVEIPVSRLSKLFYNINTSHKPSYQKLHGSYNIIKSSRSNKRSQLPQLSQRQSECLFYILQSKSAKDISGILKISQRTIEDHITKLKIAFNVDTKAQLIDKAFSLGYAQIIPQSLLNN